MKKGFTLIELIFTIVILAITTMAIPRIVAQTTELNALAIKEELVYNAKAFMSRISKAQWDSAYAADASCGGDASCMRRILTVNPPSDGAPEVRPGILNEASRRGISAQAPATKRQFGRNGISFGGGRYNDIDDFDQFTTDITVGNLVGSSSRGDFILNTRINVDVDYVAEPFSAAEYASGTDISGVLSDQPSNGAVTNIKMVRVAATDLNDAVARDGAAKSVVLKAFLSNIGVGVQTTVTRLHN
ncbi:type II secretion system protein [uncultured Campylobacter sp.]|jgi:prokaryotic N-methylation motif domain protein|uniref:type II secretion system protein n=1 Tax=uncultured Campylobacter sp. TaxID=218934 RepID=UPI002617783B|nr:type II secretion system protein [uncultured Campylobacter sp.]